MRKESFIGRKLNGVYEIQSFLGEGAFGYTFKAVDKNSKKKVAVKISQRPADKEEIEDFKEEARRNLFLQHPHIIPVYWYDTEKIMLRDENNERIIEEYPYIVMKYADLGTLKDRLARYRMTGAETIFFTGQATEGVQYAHDNRIVHRDLKPGNLLLESTEDPTEQRLYVSDFGAAVIAHTDKSISIQALAGTPPYMAPEQFLGQAMKESDQYSMGIMNYEMLTGRLPFIVPSTDLSLWAKAHYIMPPPPFREAAGSRMNATLEHLEEPVMKALEKDPQNRYGSISEYFDALSENYHRSLEKDKAGIRIIDVKTPKVQNPSRPPIREPATPEEEIIEPGRQDGFFKKHYKGVAALAAGGLALMIYSAATGGNEGYEPPAAGSSIQTPYTTKEAPPVITDVESLIQGEKQSWSAFLGKDVEIPQPPKELLPLLEKANKEIGSYSAHYFPKLTLNKGTSYPGYVKKVNPFLDTSFGSPPKEIRVGGYWALFDDATFDPDTYEKVHDEKLTQIAKKLGINPKKVRLPHIMEHDVLRNIYFPHWGLDAVTPEWVDGDIYGNSTLDPGTAYSVGSDGGGIYHYALQYSNLKLDYRPMIVFGS